MSFMRHRSDRPDRPAQNNSRHRSCSRADNCSPRCFQATYTLYSQRPFRHQSDHQPADSDVDPSPIQHNNPNSADLEQPGKIFRVWTGRGSVDHHRPGPGQVIVTDTTPDDGSLDDEIDTIQIIGSNLVRPM